MTRTISRTLFLSGMLLALGMIALPFAAHAEEKCVDYYNAAGKSLKRDGKDLKAVSALLGKAGGCCATNIDPTSAQKIVGNIRAIVSAATTNTNKAEAGKVMSTALGCAGQPSIVAVDPTLYSTVLADSAEFAELARDENGNSTDPKVTKDVQFARQHGNRPSNNQQPTVSIEQK